jgi:predicted XRE-type DNA-binding protein
MGKSGKIKVERGTTNLFADIGYRNPEEALFKAELTWQINQIIKRKRLTQTEAAKVLGTQQSRISGLNNGVISGFSIDSLLHFLDRLNSL